jgi:hypothetical protein
MLSNDQKAAILELLEEEKERLGSYRAVAKKCGISEASVSLLRKGTYGADTEAVLASIGIALGYDLSGGEWKMADTDNFHNIVKTFNDAKAESMFIAISHMAGSGKTSASRFFLNANRKNCCFKVECMEWTARQLLSKIGHEIGADFPKGYANIDAMIDAISETFKRMAAQKPLLIIDQANSLKTSALRTFIHLSDKNEDILGCVILGTENLEYEIKRGVRLNRLGYDEVDSRFGRKYIHLNGASLSDVCKICASNGISNQDVQKRIFEQSNPVRILTEDGRSKQVVQDLRRVKRLIKAERIIMGKYGNN